MWANLLPTAVALAFYFCVADAVLILQCLYYNVTNLRNEAAPTGCRPIYNDQQPLLPEQTSSNNSLECSPNLSTTEQHQNTSSQDDLFYKALDSKSETHLLPKLISVLSVFLLGAAGWAAAWNLGLWVPVVDNPESGSEQGLIGAQLLGYVSAVFYLG